MVSNLYDGFGEYVKRVKIGLKVIDCWEKGGSSYGRLDKEVMRM